jgi:nitrite reductase/ring-hydroxylating ferredoxin subunit
MLKGIKAIAIVLMLGLISCGKDDGSYVPTVGVNLQAPLSDPRVSALNAIGGSVLINGYGVAGLVIYHKPDGSYAAFDRCSSYNPQNKCAVTIDNTGLTLTDPCSGSKFSIADGSPVKAPATKSLKAYNAYVYNFQIFVTN